MIKSTKMGWIMQVHKSKLFPPKNHKKQILLKYPNRDD